MKLKIQIVRFTTVFVAFLFLIPVHAFSEPVQPAPVLTIVQTYAQLVAAIREVRAESQKRIEKAIDQEKVREAWETGRLIDQHILQHKERADYGGQVLKRLASDLGTSDTELYRMLKFFRQYPIFASTQKLSWSHYREILSLDDAKARKEVEDEAVRQRWSEKQVRAEVRRRQVGPAAAVKEFPAVMPGKVYTYRVVKAAVGPYQGQLGVDLGFSNYFLPADVSVAGLPEGIESFKEGDIVMLENGKLKNVSARDDELFTYNAYVTELIDGDTFHALVDLGFKFVTEQKLRLRGLDAPQIESAGGREAKAFLEARGVRPGAQVLVKTAKPDKYDRYLADVWVPATKTTAGRDGTYINQQLFDEGLAVTASD